LELHLNTVSLVNLRDVNIDRFLIVGFNNDKSMTVETIVTIRFNLITLFLLVIKKE